MPQGRHPGYMLQPGRGRCCRHRGAAERAISQADARVAAIARSRGASVATRNLGEFAGCGVELIDPWRRRAG